MPRHELEPPQWGWTSKMPFRAAHCIANCSCVRSNTTLLEVTCGFGETPLSHSVAGMGVSPSDAEIELEPAVELLLQPTATDKRPPSAAASRAWLALEPWSADNMR
jgi:hypothetical protein